MFCFPEHHFVAGVVAGNGSLLLGTTASVSLSLDMTGSLTALSTRPSPDPLDPGASWAAAHQLPHPLCTTKALSDWTMHDTQIWMQAMGACVARWGGRGGEGTIDFYAGHGLVCGEVLCVGEGTLI